MMNKQIYFCILVALVLILIGQIPFIPFTLSGLWAVVLLVLVWRYLKNQITAFSNWILVPFTIVSIALIFLQYRSLFGVEAGVAFLCTCLIAKTMEVKNTRDLLVVFNFALFVSASLLLHSQAFWMALVVFSAFIMCMVGLYRIQTALFQQKTASNQFRRDLKQIFKFVAVATPFFILLFIFFPRLPPLWAIPIQQDRATTGISDRMSPGDIAELSQSSALAFRIVANMNQLPSRNDLYWRALVLDMYDGSTWTSHYSNQSLKRVNYATQKQVKYQYLSADEQSNWIMGLEYSVPQERYLQVYQDDSIRPSKLIKRNQPIQMLWLGRISAQSEVLNPIQIEINTRYIEGLDPKAQKLAETLLNQSQHQPNQYIRSVLAWYRKNGFVYTLTPGTLGGNRIDQFLFSSRKGFCEHYASSFVMLMRYAGIPARVVTGYQGGQLAPDNQSWEVRQLDAHAWSEVYLNGKWQRIDPTAMIAPQRIDTGMQNYLAQDETVWGDQQSEAWRLQQFKMLKNMRIWSDYLSYQWQSKVVGYDVEKQKNWLSRLGLNSSYAYVIILIGGFGSILILYAAYYWWVQRSKQTSYDREIQKFQKKLPIHLQKRHSETFQMWIHRLSEQANGHQSFEQLIVLYQKIIFKEQKDENNLMLFKRLLKDCAITLKQVQKNL